MNKRMVTLRLIVAQKGLQTGPFGSQLKAEEYTESGVPVVMPKDIFAGKIVSDDIARISEEKARKLAKHMILPGDIIFPRRGDLGRIAVAEDENKGWLCGTGCLRARLKENVDTYYIHQYVQLETVKQWLESNALGQTMPNLNTEIIGNLPVYLVTKREQTAIAELLSTWDEAIEKTERIITAKKNQFIVLRTNIFNQDVLQSTRYQLNDIFSPVIRKNDVGEVNVLTSSAKQGLVSQLGFYKKSVSAQDLSGYYLLKRGEFAYNRSSANGYPYGAIKRLDSCSQGVLSTLYLCFAIKDEKQFHSDFLVHLFESSNLNRQLRSICQEGARSHGLLNVTKSDFLGLEIPIPEVEQQIEIAETLNTARQEIRLLKKQAESYRRQKRGLMQKLLTGQWKVRIESEEK